MKYSVTKILLWLSALVLIIMNDILMFKNPAVSRPFLIAYLVTSIVVAVTMSMFIYFTQYKPDMTQGVQFGI